MLSHRIKSLPHSGKTLQDHLEGTAKILQSWLCSKVVIDAGLYHSVYGTSIYKNIATTDRSEVISLIGEYAESLVYKFCNTPNIRMINFIQNNDKELILVECANLMEQKSRNFNLLELAVNRVPKYIEENIKSYIVNNH